MADAAIQRKRVSGPATTTTVRPADGTAAAGTAGAGRTITPLKGASDLARYVPTEAVAVYVAVLAGAFTAPTLSANQKLYQLDYTNRWWFFGAMLVVTAALSWLIYAAKTRTEDRTRHDVPVFEMVIATVAMAAWAAALPDSPFADFKWYGGWFPPIVLGTTTALIPLIAEALGKTAPTYVETDDSTKGGDGGSGDSSSDASEADVNKDNAGSGASTAGTEQTQLPNANDSPSDEPGDANQAKDS
jgi:hypothetical protein